MRRLNKTFGYEKQLKNRSSKHLSWLTGPSNKPYVRSMSKAALTEFAKNSKDKNNIYDQELRRRAKKNAKKNGTAPSREEAPVA